MNYMSTDEPSSIQTPPSLLERLTNVARTVSKSISSGALDVPGQVVGGVVLDSSAELGIFSAETTLEAAHSDHRLQVVAVLLLTTVFNFIFLLIPVRRQMKTDPRLRLNGTRKHRQ
jgi:hypothetical protein